MSSQDGIRQVGTSSWLRDLQIKLRPVLVPAGENVVLRAESSVTAKSNFVPSSSRPEKTSSSELCPRRIRKITSCRLRPRTEDDIPPGRNNANQAGVNSVLGQDDKNFVLGRSATPSSQLRPVANSILEGGELRPRDPSRTCNLVLAVANAGLTIP